ncbi:DUF4373 domain-containing protein [Alistipes putredinis]|uniref:DUF4373 domain-containing protein n=1 Tax=Alistipes putredinis TaxID=28117 RepID=UPI003AF9A2B5
MGKKSNSNRNYFPHEYTAKDDPKCERLIFEMGMEGYGIFWALLEVLRAQPDYTYPLANIPLAAYKYRTDPEKMRRVVFDFGLFVIIEDKIFFSNGLKRRMQPMDEEHNIAIESGKRGAEKRWRNRAENRVPINSPNRDPYSNKNRIDKNRIEENIDKKHTNVCKESADKPHKVASKRTAFVAPSLEELRVFISEQGLKNVNPEEFIDHYTANGWRAGRNPMKDWKATARNWNRRSPEFNTPKNSIQNESKQRYKDL